MMSVCVLRRLRFEIILILVANLDLMGSMLHNFGTRYLK